jgi:hypothetical protein
MSGVDCGIDAIGFQARAFADPGREDPAGVEDATIDVGFRGDRAVPSVARSAGNEVIRGVRPPGPSLMHRGTRRTPS